MSGVENDSDLAGESGIHEAAMQLQELAGKDDLDYYERSRITARITELRMELAKLGLEEE